MTEDLDNEWEPIETEDKEGRVIEVKGGTYGCEFAPLEFYNAPIRGTELVYWNNHAQEYRNGLYHYYPEFWRNIE